VVRCAERILDAAGNDLGVALVRPPQIGRHAPVVAPLAVLPQDASLDTYAVAGELLPELRPAGKPPARWIGRIDLRPVGEQEPATLPGAVAPQLEARGERAKGRRLLTGDRQTRLGEQSGESLDVREGGIGALVAETAGQQEREEQQEQDARHSCNVVGS